MTQTTKVYLTDGGDTLAIDQTNGGKVTVNGTDIAADLAGLGGLAAELAILNGITAGTVTAGKVVSVDTNKDASAFRTVGVVNLDAGAPGTAGTVDVFPATASKGKLAITCANQTGDTTVTLAPAAMGQATAITIPDPGAATASVLLSGTSKTAATVDASLAKADGSVAGVAASYKIARGVTAVTGTQEVTTGLATVVSIVAMLAEDPSADATIATVVIPTQTGGDAGKATLKVWKPTAADNSAPIGASAAKNVAWIAIGT
jgi:hypothetical protein